MRLSSREWVVLVVAVAVIAGGLYYNGFRWPTADRTPYLVH